jgi:hypothetical protein
MKPNVIGQELRGFFIMFGKAFRQGKQEAFETVLLVAMAPVCKWYNPKEVADFLGIPHQPVSAERNTWRLDDLREMLLSFLVNPAGEALAPLFKKSPATQSSAGLTWSVDNRVIDRLGRGLRCPWSWSSGRWKKVVKGQDLLGIVMPLNGKGSPV